VPEREEKQDWQSVLQILRIPGDAAVVVDERARAPKKQVGLDDVVRDQQIERVCDLEDCLAALLDA
jgi:hypothetical protein